MGRHSSLLIAGKGGSVDFAFVERLAGSASNELLGEVALFFVELFCLVRLVVAASEVVRNFLLRLRNEHALKGEGLRRLAVLGGDAAMLIFDFFRQDQRLNFAEHVDSTALSRRIQGIKIPHGVLCGIVGLVHGSCY